MTGTAVVTGATGFAGRHLLRRLVTEGTCDRIVGWSRPGGSARTDLPGVAWDDVDLLNRASVGAALRSAAPDAIFHLAGAPHVGSSWNQITAHLRIHGLGTHYLLEAIRLHVPAARTLVVSTGLVYAAAERALTEDAPLIPASPYALSKLAEEQLALQAARTDNLQVIVARPFNHIGPGQSPQFAASGFAQQIARIEAGRASPEIHVGNLDTYRDLTDVRDTVRAYTALMSTGQAGRAYNVCSGTAVQTRAVLNRLVAMSKARVTIADDPSRMRRADVPFVQGSAERLTRETGWQPAIPLEATLADLLDDWRGRFGESS